MAENKNTRVGLDIGSHAIKVVEITGGREKPELIGFGMKKVSGIAKGDLAGAVRGLCAESGISSKEAAVSVSGQSVIVRFISMPRMDDAALKSAIRFEAEKLIPFDINNSVIDFRKIKVKEADNKERIVLAAAKKEAVEERIAIATQAGFSVTVVDVDCFAIANSFSRNFPDIAPEKTSALINIGGSSTNLSILRGDTIFFARDIAIGADDFSSAVSKRMSVDKEAADTLIASPKDKAQEVAECMKTIFNNLFEEFKLSFNYYENEGGKPVDDVYASGGGLALSGLGEIFQENLGSKPTLWKPLSFLAKERPAVTTLTEENERSFAVAAGLALR